MRSEEKEGGAASPLGLPAAASWFVSPPATAPREWAAPFNEPAYEQTGSREIGSC